MWAVRFRRVVPAYTTQVLSRSTAAGSSGDGLGLVSFYQGVSESKRMAGKVLVAGRTRPDTDQISGLWSSRQTVWEIPSDVEPRNLWGHLSDVLTNTPSRNDRRLFVADSKQVYSPSDGVLDWKETGCAQPPVVPLRRPAVDFQSRSTSRWGDSFARGFQHEPWNHQHDPELPVESLEEELLSFVGILLEIFDRTEIRLRSVRSRV